VTIDIGTGDGRSALAAAAADPRTLVIGLDADAASMAEASRRAARAATKRGLTNALFLVAAAEAPPPELANLADRITIHFPWGSLLRGCLGLAPAAAAGIAVLANRRATIELLLAPAARDGLEGIPTEPAAIVDAVRSTFAPFGFELVAGRVATDAEIAASRSTWARRLLAGNGRRDRAVTLVRLRSSGR